MNQHHGFTDSSSDLDQLKRILGDRTTLFQYADNRACKFEHWQVHQDNVALKALGNGQPCQAGLPTVHFVYTQCFPLKMSHQPGPQKSGCDYSLKTFDYKNVIFLIQYHYQRHAN